MSGHILLALTTYLYANRQFHKRQLSGWAAVTSPFTTDHLCLQSKTKYWQGQEPKLTRPALQLKTQAGSATTFIDKGQKRSLKDQANYFTQERPVWSQSDKFPLGKWSMYKHLPRIISLLFGEECMCVFLPSISCDVNIFVKKMQHQTKRGLFLLISNQRLHSHSWSNEAENEMPPQKRTLLSTPAISSFWTERQFFQQQRKHESSHVGANRNSLESLCWVSPSCCYTLNSLSVIWPNSNRHGKYLDA